MSLRSDATQAIAKALWSKVQDEYDDEWADIALDALLDFLEAHTDEWEAARMDYWSDTTADGLLAVLREP